MNSNLKKGGLAALLASAAVVGALTFGGNALAQTPTPGTPQTAPQQRGPRNQQAAPGAQAQPGMKGGRGGAHLDSAATALGIDAATLRTELQAGKSIADVAKAKGTDVNTVIDAIVTAETANIKQRVTDMVNNVLPQGGMRGGPGGPGGMRGAGGPQIDAVTSVLGMDAAALRTELQAGKSLADVAKAKGVDVNTVIDAMYAAEKARIDQAVTDGKLTQAQADARLADAKTRITEMVNSVRPQMGPGNAPGGRGPGRGPGQRPAAPANTSG